MAILAGLTKTWTQCQGRRENGEPLIHPSLSLSFANPSYSGEWSPSLPTGALTLSMLRMSLPIGEGELLELILPPM